MARLSYSPEEIETGSQRQRYRDNQTYREEPRMEGKDREREKKKDRWSLAIFNWKKKDSHCMLNQGKLPPKVKSTTCSIIAVCLYLLNHSLISTPTWRPLTAVEGFTAPVLLQQKAS